MFRRFALLAGLIAFCLSARLPAAAVAQQRPNIMLIVADDLGYSDLGCYGSEIDTPNIDALAKEGVQMTRFYSAGRCCPSRASILTGLYSHRAGLGYMVGDLGAPGYRGRLADDAVTIGQALQLAGYRTFMSGKWHLGTRDPTQRGFEEYYGTLVSAQTYWDPNHFLRLPADRTRREYKEGEFYGTNSITDYAIDFLNEARETPDQPWFLYLAYNSPHFPLQAPPEDIAKYAERYKVGWDVLRDQRYEKMKQLGVITESTKLTPRSEFWGYRQSEPQPTPAWTDLPADRREDLARRMAIFAAMIDVMDRNIGRIIPDLRAHGEMDNTLIIFISDNGACAEWDPNGFDGSSSPNNILHTGDQLAQMGQDGTYHSVGSGWANASNTPWRLYKHYNHEGGISSPFIAHWPAGLERHDVLDGRPGHIIDLMPTILDAAGATYPAEMNGQPTAALAGRSLLPLLQGEEVPQRELFFEHEGNRAVTDGHWKLTAVRGQPWELYDTDVDRTELDNLAAEHPDIVQKLDSDWNKWAEENRVLPRPRSYRAPFLPPGT